MRAAEMFLLCLCLVACGSRNEFAYSGTVQAESAAVGSTIGGRVISVEVASGQRVRAGQVLVKLDDSAQRAALAQARAQLDQAQAALAGLTGGAAQAQREQAAAQTRQAAAGYQKTAALSQYQIVAAQQGVRQARAEVEKARAAAAQAQTDAARVELLYSQGAVAAQQRDTAASTAQQATATLTAAKTQLATAQSNLNATRGGSAPADVTAASGAYQAAAAGQRSIDVNSASQIQQARSVVEVARSNVSAAQTRLDEMTIRAPADGTVEDIDLHPGDLVAPNAPVAMVDEFRDPYVRIYLSQADLARITTGSVVRVRSDETGQTFGGLVEQIDTTAQFTPQNVQTPEDRAALNFGVKVGIHDPNHVLRAGTTAEVALP